MKSVRIVSLKPQEWQQYKNLRLRALKEEPQAFSSTYEDNIKHSDKYWQEILEGTVNKNAPWFIFAKKGDVVIGHE